jgi:hypothetical protein
MSEDFNRISQLQIASTNASGRALSFAASTSPLGDFLLCEGNYAAVSTTLGILQFAGVTTRIVRNSIIIQRGSAADHICATGTSNVNLFNCTFVASDDLATAPTSIFISDASGTVNVQNCGLFAGDSTKAIKAGSATYNFTTCYSDISGTAGVTQTTYGNEFQNVNDATRDFRLKTGAAQIDTGTTDTTNAAIDIAKTNRPSGAAYDVGAWEFVHAGGGETVITGFGRRMQIVAG